MLKGKRKAQPQLTLVVTSSKHPPIFEGQYIVRSNVHFNIKSASGAQPPAFKVIFARPLDCPVKAGFAAQNNTNKLKMEDIVTRSVVSIPALQITKSQGIYMVIVLVPPHLLDIQDVGRNKEFFL